MISSTDIKESKANTVKCIDILTSSDYCVVTCELQKRFYLDSNITDSKYNVCSLTQS